MRVLAFYKCAKCSKLEPEYLIELDIRNLDKRIKCKHCKKATQTSEWNCECGVPWFTCGMHCHPRSHQEYIQQSARKENPKRKMHKGETPKVKVSSEKVEPLEAPPTFSDLLHEDLANASRSAEHAKGVKRKADIPIGKTPSKSPKLLGPILGERFKALGTRIARHL